VVIVVVDEASRGAAGVLPDPLIFVGVWAVWEVLALVAEVGPEAARFSGLFSGLVLAAVALSRPGALVTPLQNLFRFGQGPTPAELEHAGDVTAALEAARARGGGTL
jgi:hypothetical protein